MQRRGPSSRKLPSDNGSSNNGTRKNDARVRSGGLKRPSFIPKSLVGVLIITCGLLLLVLISQLTTTTSSGSGGKRNLRTDKAGNKKQDPVSSSSQAAEKIQSSAVRAAEMIQSSSLNPVGLTSPATNATLHVIFSTDCSSYQHWQSYLFFHAALKVRQPGYVTRIASGCSDKDLKKEREWHMEHIQSKMSDRFRIHFTPHFSGVKDEETGEVKGDYKFFNKPFGLKHFLEHDELMGFKAGDKASGGIKKMKHPTDIIILTDPDQVLLRPITDDFTSERETLVGPRRKSIYQKEEVHIVTPGHPYGQTYGLGTQWRKFDLDAIAGPASPAKDVDQKEGGLYYPVGPPYVVTAKDMHKIAVTWSEFAPRVHKQYPHLLAEMYAYCIAAAHLRLPHMLVDSLMVSAAGVGGEGWKFVKDIPAQEVCTFAADPNHDVHPVPSVIHFCQRYAVDRYFWGKRKVPHDIFTCEHPLLVEPPADLGSGKYLSVTPRGGKPKELTAEKEKMEAFMVCALTRATNDAMMYFKTNHCEKDGWNREKAYDMWAGKEVAASR